MENTQVGILLQADQSMKTVPVVCTSCGLAEARPVIIEDNIVYGKRLSPDNRCTRCHKKALSLDRSNL